MSLNSTGRNGACEYYTSMNELQADICRLWQEMGYLQAAVRQLLPEIEQIADCAEVVDLSDRATAIQSELSRLFHADHCGALPEKSIY